MNLSRRQWLQALVGAALFGGARPLLAGERKPAPLRITGMRITPIARPDPPILAASGCHGPYFLRNIVELETDGKITGIAETRGGEATLRALEKARDLVVGQNAFAYRAFGRELYKQ